ncbi:restriction endonuclease subunit S [Vibrio fluvialis]|uniref:restriction endonuclease subunit S n=1 Tax=Vibrio fluvialis TaxID=676 RepID=UPI001EE9BBDE|nr:restriction endonuclease subunit S [Vibrio fluvialis]MCG6345839.1 restriction endonuclease subunit S [Vibrio fluvialis]
MSWPLVKLGDLFKVTSGGTPSRKKSEYYNGGNIHWVKTGDLHNKYVRSASEFITQEGLDGSSARLYPKGTVLVAMYGATIGACSILDIEAATNQACAAFTPAEKVDPVFLYYLLKHSKPAFVKAGSGGAQPNISGTFLKNFEIPLPPLAEQKRIAAILDKADAIRQKRKQAIELADEFLRSVFLDMFGDPVANPKGWEVRTLGELATKVTDGEHQTPKRSDKGFKLLSARNIQQGYIDIESEKVDYVGEAEFQRITKRLSIRKSDVLLSCSGTIGRVSMNTLNEPFCLVRSVAVIRLAENGVSPEYLVGYLGTSAMQSVMKKEANSSGQPNLFQNQIKQLKVLVPPLEIQNKYKELCDYFVSKKGSLDRAEEHQTELFRSLSQKAFSGQL